MSNNVTEIIFEKGRPRELSSIRAGGNILVIRGRLLKTASLKDEWYEGFQDPDRTISELQSLENRPDLLTFWQRLPDTEPMYPYYRETEQVAAVRIKSFDDWWNNQLKSETRKKARRAEKRGVEIKVEPLSDAFVRGVVEVFAETPVRRGKPFWHYKKDFETVKQGLMRDLDRSDFIGAYFEGSMIGFVKLVYAEGRFANPGLIITMIRYQNKYITSALIAKCIELCDQRGIPYMTYTTWRRGSHAAFLRRHGFHPIGVPRYWYPLTLKGKVGLSLGAHRRLRKRLPERLMLFLLKARQRYYARTLQEDSD